VQRHIAVAVCENLVQRPFILESLDIDHNEVAEEDLFALCSELPHCRRVTQPRRASECWTISRRANPEYSQKLDRALDQIERSRAIFGATTSLAVLRDVDYVLHQEALLSVPGSINDPITTSEVNGRGGARSNGRLRFDAV
jgi:hypothetical protein